MADTWSIRGALHQVVLAATRRMTDEGLAARVLANEGRIITAEAHEDALRAILTAPWRDEFGALHCARCAGLVERLPKQEGRLCSCRPLRRYHGVAA